MLEKIRTAIPRPLRLRLSNYYKNRTGGYAVRSYSQEGEDRILARYFPGKKDGFYVDVGAHHPQRYSNTYLFYRMGWSGINIDAMPGSMNDFQKLRPRDINIECGVSSKEGVLNYFVFNEPALNGFNADLSAEREKEYEQFHVIDRLEVAVRPLSAILDEHVAGRTEIDFLTIDVEGLDYEVLLSNDWERFRPKMVLVEILKTDLSTYESSPIGTFLAQQGYTAVAKTYNTYFFRDTARDI